jgi:hypothetical protein
MKTKILLFSSYLLLAIACSSNATFINGTFTAVVTRIDAAPDFPVSVGDTFQGQFSYDTSFLLPPDAYGNRLDPGRFFGGDFDMSGSLNTRYTMGDLFDGDLLYLTIGPDGMPDGAYSIDFFGNTLSLGGHQPHHKL